MSHEAHTDNSGSQENTKVSFSSSFWLVIILVLLLVGSLNFIQTQTSGHSEEEATEQHHEGKEAKEGKEGKAEGEEATKPAAEQHTENHEAPEHK